MGERPWSLRIHEPELPRLTGGKLPSARVKRLGTPASESGDEGH